MWLTVKYTPCDKVELGLYVKQICNNSFCIVIILFLIFRLKVLVIVVGCYIVYRYFYYLVILELLTSCAIDKELTSCAIDKEVVYAMQWLRKVS